MKKPDAKGRARRAFSLFVSIFCFPQGRDVRGYRLIVPLPFRLRTALEALHRLQSAIAFVPPVNSM